MVTIQYIFILNGVLREHLYFEQKKSSPLLRAASSLYPFIFPVLFLAGFLKCFSFFRIPCTINDHVRFDLSDLPEKVQFLLHVDLLEIAVWSVFDQFLVLDVRQFLRIDPVHSVTVLDAFAGTEEALLIPDTANDNFHGRYLVNVLVPFGNLIVTRLP